jgi:PERQ amino acid-rich with GYF domain-containing protein
MSRRRFSEASMKASHFGTEIQGEDSVSKPGSITEVKEEDSTMVQVQEEDGPVSSAGMDSAMSTSHSEISVTMNTVDSPLDLTGVGTIPPTYHEHQEMGRSPVMLDLAAVQWSYKDPTGQVQGRHSLL